MRTEYLYELIKLNEIGNFQAAADALFISQSTLSKHIQVMEKELGFSLISHSRMGFSLTPEGMEFIPYAVRICDIRNEYTTFFKNRRNSLVLDIGTCSLSSIEDEMFSNAVLRFSKAYPDCMIRTPSIMATTRVDELLTDSERSRFACVIAKALSSDTPVESSFIKKKVLFRWPVSVLVRKDSQFCRDGLTLSDIAGESLISLAYHTFSNALAVKAFRSQGLIPVFSDTLNSFRSICDFVKNDKGLYLVTEPIDASALPEELTLAGIYPKITAETFAAYNNTFNHDFEKHFLKCLSEEFDNGN